MCTGIHNRVTLLRMVTEESEGFSALFRRLRCIEFLLELRMTWDTYDRQASNIQKYFARSSRNRQLLFCVLDLTDGELSQFEEKTHLNDEHLSHAGDAEQQRLLHIRNSHIHQFMSIGIQSFDFIYYFMLTLVPL